MFQIISAIFLIVLAAVTKGEVQREFYISNYDIDYNTFRTDQYINMNKLQHAKNIQDYDIQMEVFKQSYGSSLDTINIRQDMLIDTLVQNENKLNPLEILSDLSHKCVSKYRPSIPTMSTTKTEMNNCVSTASKQLDSMLSSPIYTKKDLQSDYNSFDSSINSCKKKYSKLPSNYTMCVTKVIDTTNAYTINNQKNFARQMDTAQCSSTANIKKALHCSYIIESQTNSAIAEANALIKKCLAGEDDCKQCNLANSCSELSYMKRSEVSYTSRTMDNLFYGRSDIKNCLMIQIH